MSAPVPLTDVLKTWFKIGCLSFGGPAAQIALMHRIIVDEKRWLSETQYLNALSFCMLLPGPEAMQLATYAAWRTHGTIGGLISGLLFVLPGACVMFALSVTYLLYGNTPVLQTAFLGIKAAVLVIVLDALLKVAKRALTSRIDWAIAALSFIALFLFNIPFPLIIIVAALAGAACAKPQNLAPPPPTNAAPNLATTLKTAAVWLTIWVAPVIALVLTTQNHVLTDISLFFSKLSAVSFGGAYTALAYMAQDAVQNQHWLSAAEMLDGLGLAETTPGPLILVTEFVGTLAAAHASDGTTVNLAAGALGALITLWMIFAPCFLWVFTGAPYIEWIASRARLKSALSAISAAVVGVILNLSLWFALHVVFKEVTQVNIGIGTLWQPTLTTLDPNVLILSALSALTLLVLKRNILTTLLIAASTALLISDL